MGQRAPSRPVLGRHVDNREALIRRWLPLAQKLARRYQRATEPAEDLVQVAYLGLVKAADSFDETRGAPFATYASTTILGELKHHLRDSAWAIHVPRGLQDRALRVHRAVAEGDERGVTRTPGELAEELQLDVCDVLEALQAREAFAATSLSAAAFSAADEAPPSLGDTLGSPEDGYERVELRVMLDGGLRALRAREREILRMRFVEDRTQSDIAATVGVSQMHVSRLLRESLERLRLSLEHAA